MDIKKGMIITNKLGVEARIMDIDKSTGTIEMKQRRPGVKHYNYECLHYFVELGTIRNQLKKGLISIKEETKC